MTFAKRFAATFLAVALLAFGGLALTGCQNNEDVVREGVAAELDKLKTLDDETLELLASEAGADDLATYGIDAKEFISSYLAGFDYRIDSVTVDGDNATATVVLTCKSFSQYEQGIQDASASLASDESILDMSADELNQKIGETVMSVIDDIPTAETDPIDLTFTLQDKTWTPTAETEQAIATALFSN